MRGIKNNPILAYKRLSNPLAVMVKILAVHVLDFRQKDLETCCFTLGVKDGKNQHYNSRTLQVAVKQLHDLGLIQKTATGISCVDAVRIMAVTDAVLNQEFDKISRAVSTACFVDEYEMIFSGKLKGIYRAFQLAVFNNEEFYNIEVILQAGWDYLPYEMTENPLFFLYFNHPFQPGLMDCLEPDIRGKVLFFTLIETDSLFKDATGLLDYAGRFFRQCPGKSEEKSRYMESLLLRGDLKTHQDILESVRQENHLIYSIHMGCRDMVCNNNKKALTNFEQSLVLVKKNTRKRKIFLPGLSGLFFLFALLKSNDRKLFKSALDHIDNAIRTPGAYNHLFISMRSVFREGLGMPKPITDAQRSGKSNDKVLGHKGLIRLMIRAWTDKENTRAYIPELKKIQTMSAAAGQLWIEAETSALLAYIEEDEKENTNRSARIHKRLGTQSLVDIVEVAPKWEKALDALIHIGQDTVSSNGQPGVVHDQRLVWLLFYRKESRMASIIPRLQKLTKKKTWTQGRAVALKNLCENMADMDWLTDQDRAACRTIEAYTYQDDYYGYHTRVEYNFDTEKTLNALAGHPLIFLGDALDIPVELIKAGPEVRLRMVNDKIRLEMAPIPFFEGQKTAVVRETATRFKVVNFSEKHRDIARLLGKDGLSLPKDAEKKAVQAMTSLSSQVQVHSDLAVAGSGQAKQITADPRPHVHVLPWQDGICVEIWARPFKDSGSYFKPGQGGVHVFAETTGEKVQTQRDLAMEMQLAQELIALCPMLGHLEPVDGQWQAGDPEQALELLSELKQCENQAVLEWPRGEKIKIASQASFDQLRLAIKKDRDWFKATGSLVLDNNTSLELKKLMVLLENATGRFLPLDDGTFLSITRALKERLEELKAYSSVHDKGLRFPPLAGPAIEDITRQAGQLKTDKAWKDHCTRLSQIIEPELPGTLQAELRPYQYEGFKWLAQLNHWQVGACLADDMGLGKTVQSLAAMLLTADKGPALVVAPLSVMANWQEECQRFAPTLIPHIFGPGNRQDFLNHLNPFDIVISSYGLLQTEAKMLAGVDWQTVVLDEAQAIKNIKSKRTRAAMGLNARFRLITTGTPVENRLDELWTLFNFINPGLLGSYNKFRETFILPIERDRNKETSRRLKKLIRPFILRRLKTDVLKELPQKTQITLQVEMSPQEAALYEAQRLKSLERIEDEGDENSGKKHLRILAELTKLRQLCCNPCLILPKTHIKSSKLKVFSDTVDELLENRHKALVFSQFVGHLQLLKKFLDSRNISYQYLDGSTSAKERKKRINAFQNGQGDLFLISLKAGGSGLNLTAADYVIHMDPWWNPAVEDQASDRAHRIGQTRPVTVYRLVVKDSIEEMIINLHKEKRDLAQCLLSGTDVAGKISAGELLDLLKGQT